MVLIAFNWFKLVLIVLIGLTVGFREYGGVCHSATTVGAGRYLAAPFCHPCRAEGRPLPATLRNAMFQTHQDRNEVNT